jgi:hypothetical protein
MADGRPSGAQGIASERSANSVSNVALDNADAEKGSSPPDSRQNRFLASSEKDGRQGNMSSTGGIGNNGERLTENSETPTLAGNSPSSARITHRLPSSSSSSNRERRGSFGLRTREAPTWSQRSTIQQVCFSVFSEQGFVLKPVFFYSGCHFVECGMM